MFVLLRIAFSVYGWWRLFLDPNINPRFHGSWENLQTLPTSPLYPWLSPWEHLDALWYQELAIHGYVPGNDTVHFPPLMSGLSRLVMLLVPNFSLSALMVNGIAVIVAFVFLRRMARIDSDAGTGERAALYMAAFPVGFFLFAPFTEALFLMTTVLVFYALRLNWWWLAGAFGFFATLTRWQGALISPVMFLWYAWEVWRGRRKLGLDVLATALPGLAYVLFSLYARFIVGETRSMNVVNGDWGIVWLAPWDVVQRGVAVIAKHNAIELLNLGAVVLVVALGIAAIKYLWPPLTLYLWSQVLFALFHISYVSPLASTSRYMITIFPAFLVLARFGNNKWVNQAVLVIFLLLQGSVLWWFTSGEWVA